MELLDIAAWFYVAIVIVALVGGPFLIGKHREPYSALGYLWTVFCSFAILPVLLDYLGVI